MIIHERDRRIVKWSVDHGFPYSYTREYGLPEPLLRVQLGLSNAFFNRGKLVHWRADTAADYLDQLMFELSVLFGCCAQFDAYPPQQVFLSEEELRALIQPCSRSA